MSKCASLTMFASFPFHSQTHLWLSGLWWSSNRTPYPTSYLGSRQLLFLNDEPSFHFQSNKLENSSFLFSLCSFFLCPSLEWGLVIPVCEPSPSRLWDEPAAPHGYLYTEEGKRWIKFTCASQECRNDVPFVDREPPENKISEVSVLQFPCDYHTSNWWFPSSWN